MESIYAALLLYKANSKITEANLEKVLNAAGVEVDKSQLTKLVAGLKETNIDTIIKSAAAPVMAAPIAVGGSPKAKPKKEKKEEEPETDEEPTGIGSLF